jgi:cyclic pyranopterin phosphate synthase
MSKLNHLDDQGNARMVDISHKPDSERTAKAEADVILTKAIVDVLQADSLPKGDLFATVRIAAIQASKKCAELIPLCHPLPLTNVTVDLFLDASNCELKITVTCKTSGKTGVEMEALTAASVAALTVYDMCKGIDKGVEIHRVRLLTKTGGKSGNWSSLDES